MSDMVWLFIWNFIKYNYSLFNVLWNRVMFTIIFPIIFTIQCKLFQSTKNILRVCRTQSIFKNICTKIIQVPPHKFIISSDYVFVNSFDDFALILNRIIISFNWLTTWIDRSETFMFQCACLCFGVNQFQVHVYYWRSYFLIF